MVPSLTMNLFKYNFTELNTTELHRRVTLFAMYQKGAHFNNAPVEVQLYWIEALILPPGLRIRNLPKDKYVESATVSPNHLNSPFSRPPTTSSSAEPQILKSSRWHNFASFWTKSILQAMHLDKQYKAFSGNEYYPFYFLHRPEPR